MPVFELSTTKYDKDLQLIEVAMNKVAALCNIDKGFKFGEPVSRFGWTFFSIFIDQELYFGIQDKFTDLIKRSKGDKQHEKFANFLFRYFESRGCNVKVFLVVSCGIGVTSSIRPILNPPLANALIDA